MVLGGGRRQGSCPVIVLMHMSEICRIIPRSRDHWGGGQRLDNGRETRSLKRPMGLGDIPSYFQPHHALTVTAVGKL